MNAAINLLETPVNPWTPWQVGDESVLPPSFFKGIKSKLAEYEPPFGGLGNAEAFKFRNATNWRDRVNLALKPHRDFSNHMFDAFISVCNRKNYFQSLFMVEDANKRLLKNGYSSAMSDDEIKSLAKEKSVLFTKILLAIENDSYRFMRACALLDSLGLALTDLTIIRAMNKGEIFGLVNRIKDEIWLRRQLRKKCAYEVEQVSRDLALVQRHKQVYCSDFSVHRQRARNLSNKIALEETVAYDENDEDNYFTLAELSAKSVSNPEIRRAEMFVRLRGFEEIARENGDVAVFYTLTAPSRFHAVSSGQVNQNWIDAGRPVAKQTHQYLLKVWQDLGRLMSKRDISVYGMRIAEPHQDGTPHHHLLLFMNKEHSSFVTSEFNRLAMVDSPNEKGASKYRFKALNIDLNEGSAVGYIAKYLSKNIDGKHIADDKDSSLSGIEAAERVVTWSRVNQIRQFQFVGGPSVSVWRELRRLRTEFKEGDAVLNNLCEGEHFLLEKVRKAADVGDWKGFCYAMGGMYVKRADQQLKLQYFAPDAVQKLIESGEYSPTRFGDMAEGQINGLMFKQVFICTRFRTWKVENKAKFESGKKQIMAGVSDWFDALIAEDEYKRMCEERYAEYEAHIQYLDSLEALVLSSASDIGTLALCDAVTSAAGQGSCSSLVSCQ